MHYYQHHIGDYRRDTAHLSLLEHGIYRQLMDWYYLEETPIPKETKVVFRRLRAGSEGEQKAVIDVLTDFFTLTEDGYIHTRMDKEITSYHEKAQRARDNGKGGGRPKKQQVAPEEKPTKTNPVISGNQEQTQEKANQEPLTINQEQEASADAPAPTGKQKSKLITFQTYLDSRKAAGMPPFDPGFSAERYAEEIGLPAHLYELHWFEFRHQHTDGPRASKRQASWPKAFANSIRGNWYKFWWVTPEGEFQATSAAKQAERAREAQRNAA